MQLRPYQVEAIRETRKAWHAGHTDVLGVAATGMGKTVIFCAMTDLMLEQHQGKRALILAHREELVTQPVEKLLHFYPRWKFDVGIVKAEQNECNRQIIAASVQTVCREHRLAQILAHGPINLLITDEAHHATASTYRQVYQMLREANPNMRHLGVTATPIRADGEALREVFQETAFKYDIRYGVQHGYLVPLRVLGISTAISLRGVRSTAGDFNQSQLAKVMETDNAFDLIVATHQKYAGGRRGIAFTVSVEGAFRLAEKFQEVGIRAAAASANTSKEARRDLLAKFRSGDLDLLCNVGLWTEGLDLPEINVLHMARPTQSDGLYLQMLGRGTRTAPGKEDCLILDYQAKDARQVIFAGDVLGMSKGEKEVAQAKQEEVEDDEGAVQGCFIFDGDFKGIEGDPLAILHQELDYLSHSAYQWTKEDRWLVLGLGKGSDQIERTLAITPPAETQQLLLINERSGSTHWGRQTWIDPLARGDFSELTDRANEYAETHGQAALVAKQRGWRRAPASEEQIKFLRRLGGSKHVEPSLTKGRCAELITFYKARRVLSNAGYW
jgi:ATP-dependent helicase IRC3